MARLLFIGLWTIADRDGRLLDRPKRIKAELFPYDDCDVESLLSQLASRNFIVRYVANGQKAIQIANFLKHQNPHKAERESDIAPPANRPVPAEHQTSIVQEPRSHQTSPKPSEGLSIILEEV